MLWYGLVAWASAPDVPWSAEVRFLFGDCVLDTDRRELTRGSEFVAIAPQVFDTLAHLVVNRQKVISKDDLLKAVWRGRIVSESTLATHINAVRRAIGDSGEEQRLIRTVARKGFRFVGAVTEDKIPAGADATTIDETEEAKIAVPPPPLLPDKPSIAILPFENLSGDPEQEYFADGMVEDIIIALSRQHWFFVIARNSSFTYKGRTVDVKQAGRQLGVRYLVEGGVRRAGSRVRITAQLVDATTGMHLWADRFDGTLEDIFDLQDKVASSVVGAIVRRLEQIEIERAKRKPTASLDAYDYYLRGMASFNRRTNEANSEALGLFRKASDLDSKFAAAHGMAAWCYVWRKINGWLIDREKETEEAVRLARRAIDLGMDNDDAVALARGGHAVAFMAGELASGIACVDRALALNPNLATAWYLSGWLRAYDGQTEVAIEQFAQAMRLSPLDPTFYHMQCGTGFAHLLAGRFDDAVSWAAKAFQHEPRYISAAAVMAASHALAGRKKEARAAMQRLRQIDPALGMPNLKEWFPIQLPEHFAKWAQGLHTAGLPE
jgi:TolB-like protein/Flp pilus assembly protein TadD